MEVQENVLLSTITTFKLGGPAKVVCTCTTVEDIQMALAIARERHLPWYVIGGGSNLLANDAGYEGLIIHTMLSDSSFQEVDVKNEVLAIAEAGVNWDAFVQESVLRGLWGIENLAGIPGTVGAAPVQNIGAYGAETADTLAWVETFNTETNQVQKFQNEECAFGYRDSFFKQHPEYILTRVAFTLSRTPNPRTSYADIAACQKEGALLETPQEIAKVVREIRSRKFPDLTQTGTAGSFFKNPTISKEDFQQLKETYSELPGYEAGDGHVKVSLAWILDKALQLKGYSHGAARLFENQPLVIVAEAGATAGDVDALADEISRKVLGATQIKIEREVRSL